MRTLMALTMAMAPTVEPGPIGRVEAVDGHERVRVRRAHVDDEIGDLQQALTRRGLRLRGHGLCD